MTKISYFTTACFGLAFVLLGSCFEEKKDIWRTSYIDIKVIAKRQIAEYDRDGNGQIEFRLTWPETQRWENNNRHTNSCFRRADQLGNKDKITTLDEMVAFISSSDTDGDGKLSAHSKNGITVGGELYNFLMENSCISIKNLVR